MDAITDIASIILLLVLLIFIIIMIVNAIANNSVNANTSTKVKKVLTRITSFNYNQTKSELEERNNQPYIDLGQDLNLRYENKYIPSSDEQDVISHYSELYQETYSLIKKFEIYDIVPSSAFYKVINDYGKIHTLIKSHNEKILQTELDKNKDFFDHCLKYPLDTQQRRSIVSLADNCLVVSSAGSGKTSSIVGRVKYLTEIKKVDPLKILLISFTNKAANELTERLDTKGLKGYTFHKLAIDIIAKFTGSKPTIYESTDALFINIFHKLIQNKDFKESVLKYFVDFEADETDYEQQKKDDHKRKLTSQKKNTYKALLPDMDGNEINVRSKEEQKLCFVLSSLGIKFRYEEPYEHSVNDDLHSQYRPDFSLYYTKDGITRRIYLEHFGIDDHCMVPLWFAEEKGISYEEANKTYNDGIAWKEAIHEKFGTVLINTTSADFYHLDIKKVLKQKLDEIGFPISEKSDEELFDLVLPPASKREKAFIRFTSTFVALLKSSCKSFNEVVADAEKDHSDRNEFILDKILRPVYTDYCKTLNEAGRIDFTDLILKATEICTETHPCHWDYIIVDEFQDISLDRYKFLKALREGTPKAKLYCVGDDWQSIYRFSGSDMSLFNDFPEYFGPTEINKIETTYRFGEPLINISSQFIERNDTQLVKNVKPKYDIKTELIFYPYNRYSYCSKIEEIINQIPKDKSIFLLGRYSFDDYYLSFVYKSSKEGNNFYYYIAGRKIEFLTVHKSKGLEADYVILLQCNKDIYGFPSLINDDPILNYVLTKKDSVPFAEERRLFYVAITRAKIKTCILYDEKRPSAFVIELLHPEQSSMGDYELHRNANKIWSKKQDKFLLDLYNEHKSIKQISEKMGRSQTAIKLRLDKLLN